MALGLGLGLTYVAWQGAQALSDQAGSRHFEALVRESETALAARAGLYEQALQSGAGYLAATSAVSRGDWVRYVETLNIKKNYPAMVGLGVVDYVPAVDLDAYLKRVREDAGPDFVNFPTTDNDQKYIVRYVEPAADNMAAIGFDIAFEENRRMAADKALATGSMVISRKVELVQDSSKRPAFVLLLRVPGAEGVKQWVYAPVLAHPFLAGFETATGNEVSVEIYDGQNRQASGLLYQSAAAARTETYVKETTVTIGAASWAAVWRPSAAFAPPLRPDLPKIVLYAGAGLSVLFALLSQLPVSGMRSLRQKAAAQVEELARSRDFAEQIIDALPDPLYVKNDRFEIILANQAFAALCPEGIPEESGEDQERFGNKDEAAVKRGRIEFDEDMTLSGGRVCKMHTSKISFTGPEGVPHLLAVMREVKGSAASVAAAMPSTEKPSAPPPSIEPQKPAEPVSETIMPDEKALSPLASPPAAEPAPAPAPLSESKAPEPPTAVSVPVPPPAAPVPAPEVFAPPAPEPKEIAAEAAPAVKETPAVSPAPDKKPEAPSPAALSKPAAKPPAGPRSLNILLAEDTPVNQEVTRTMLESDGHKVTIAKNGREAVAAAGQGGFDLVLMDILMPVMGGVQASREIRTTFEIGPQTLPILALTAHATTQDVATFRSAGIDDFLFKPLQKDDLVARIHKIMGWNDADAVKTVATVAHAPQVSVLEKAEALETLPEDIDLDDFGEMDLYDLPDDMYDDDILAAEIAGETGPAKNGSAGQPSVPKSPLLDYTQHHDLVNAIGRVKQKDIYDHFKIDVDERLEIIGRKGLDKERIGGNLHAMASMSGNLGLSKFSAECRRLMEALPDLSEDRIQDDIVALELLYKDSCSDYEKAFG